MFIHRSTTRKKANFWTQKTLDCWPHARVEPPFVYLVPDCDCTHKRSVITSNKRKISEYWIRKHISWPRLKSVLSLTLSGSIQEFQEKPESKLSVCGKWFWNLNLPSTKQKRYPSTAFFSKTWRWFEVLRLYLTCSAKWKNIFVSFIRNCITKVIIFTGNYVPKKWGDKQDTAKSAPLQRDKTAVS
jgi:hypothetical protein